METKIPHKKAKQPSKAKAKTQGRHQINVHLSEDLHAKLRAACSIQKHREGQLAHILIAWALPFYEGLRSVETLQKLNYQHAVTKCPDLLGN